MLKQLLIILLGLWNFHVAIKAQNFQVGRLNAIYLDADRANRQVPVEWYYPANQSGNGVAVAEGSFPLLVIAHGFLMNASHYSHLGNFYAARGWIVACVNTETGLSPNHLRFAEDMVFIGKYSFQQLNQLQGSQWIGRFNQKAVVAGHSMGGGAALLAVNLPTHPFMGYVGLAAAETNPSAIQAAGQTPVSILMFAGSNDGVTPPAQHQWPMYDAATNSLCRNYINITGGGHCFFADNSGVCELGEAATGSVAAISRETQQSIVNSLLEPWLKCLTEADPIACAQFENLRNSSNQITASTDCTTLSLNNASQSQINIWPQPAQEFIYISLDKPLISEANFEIKSMDGKTYRKGSLASGQSLFKLQCDHLNTGIYFLQIFTGNRQLYNKPILIQY